MGKKLKIGSNFAILDVNKGRHKLKRLFDNAKEGVDAQAPVSITGFIDGVWGADDGVSREFSVVITKVTLD